MLWGRERACGGRSRDKAVIAFIFSCFHCNEAALVDQSLQWCLCRGVGDTGKAMPVCSSSSASKSIRLGAMRGRRGPSRCWSQEGLQGFGGSCCSLCDGLESHSPQQAAGSHQGCPPYRHREPELAVRNRQLGTVVVAVGKVDFPGHPPACRAPLHVSISRQQLSIKLFKLSPAELRKSCSPKDLCLSEPAQRFV